jgi:hypothetical protein
MVATSRMSPPVHEQDGDEQEQEGEVADHALDRDRQQRIRRPHAALAEPVHEDQHRRRPADRGHGADHDALQVNVD